MRIFNSSSTAIDNIFIDFSKNVTINPLINGLSDDDIQPIKLENIIVPIQESHLVMLGTLRASLYMNFNLN